MKCDNADEFLTLVDSWVVFMILNVLKNDSRYNETTYASAELQNPSILHFREYEINAVMEKEEKSTFLLEQLPGCGNFAPQLSNQS
jgi:hypothetical protein